MVWSNPIGKGLFWYAYEWKFDGKKISLGICSIAERTLLQEIPIDLNVIIKLAFWIALSFKGNLSSSIFIAIKALVALFSWNVPCNLKTIKDVKDNS